MKKYFLALMFASIALSSSMHLVAAPAWFEDAGKWIEGAGKKIAEPFKSGHKKALRMWHCATNPKANKCSKTEIRTARGWLIGTPIAVLTTILVAFGIRKYQIVQAKNNIVGGDQFPIVVESIVNLQPGMFFKERQHTIEQQIAKDIGTDNDKVDVWLIANKSKDEKTVTVNFDVKINNYGLSDEVRKKALKLGNMFYLFESALKQSLKKGKVVEELDFKYVVKDWLNNNWVMGSGKGKITQPSTLQLYKNDLKEFGQKVKKALTPTRAQKPTITIDKLKQIATNMMKIVPDMVEKLPQSVTEDSQEISIQKWGNVIRVTIKVTSDDFVWPLKDLITEQAKKIGTFKTLSFDYKSPFTGGTIETDLSKNN